MIKNLFEAMPAKVPQEMTHTLLRSAQARIEYIVSDGHASPEGFWYDQEQHEWVVVLQGSARIRFADGGTADLKAGAFLNIPAHTRHRVDWTDPHQLTLWLAVHYGMDDNQPQGSPMPDLILPACLAEFRKLKANGERAMAQLSFEQCNTRINPYQNSVAAVVKHLVGNMRSRWVDFLGSDGEKPNRDRESEFHPDYPDRESMMQAWETGWACVFEALMPLTDADLSKIVYIRKEPHSVFMAINRQTAHYAGHLAQIALIAKHLKGDEWQYLTIPPGGSAAFNQSKGMK